jgi:hypothetical protein
VTRSDDPTPSYALVDEQCKWEHALVYCWYTVWMIGKIILLKDGLATLD